MGDSGKNRRATAGGVSLGEAIGGIVGRVERSNPDLTASARVKAAWNRAVGARVREHVTGVYVVPGTAASEVIVYADTPLWASELTMQSELMRLKLNMEIARTLAGRPEEAELASRNGEWVGKLRFVASKERYLARDRRRTTSDELEEEDAELAAVEPVPLSEEELERLRRETAGISDDGLREAAFGAAKASLEWQRGLDAARHRDPGK